MIDRRDHAEKMDSTDSTEPMDRTDAAEPTDPIERTDPTQPMESNEPRDPMHSSESSDHSDHFAFRPAPTADALYRAQISEHRRDRGGHGRRRSDPRFGR
jgi:hypothetical protein